MCESVTLVLHIQCGWCLGNDLSGEGSKKVFSLTKFVDFSEIFRVILFVQFYGWNREELSRIMRFLSLEL